MRHHATTDAHPSVDRCRRLNYMTSTQDNILDVALAKKRALAVTATAAAHWRNLTASVLCGGPIRGRQRAGYAQGKARRDRTVTLAALCTNLGNGGVCI